MTSALLDSWLEWLQLVRGRVLSRLDRPPRPVSEHGFDLDFADRKAVRSLFEEGTGMLLTDGSRACMRSDHCRYGEVIDEATGERGMILAMDGKGASTCAAREAASVSVGHLASYHRYAFGDFSWRARVHHAPSGSAPPANSFTCFSTYVRGTLPHNELAWCFPASNPREVHMAYWFDEGMHRAVKYMDDDLTRGVHTFTVRWREQGVDWLIDGSVVHQARGTAGTDLPWEPMSIRIIVRPKDVPTRLLGESHVGLSRVSYVPWATPQPAATATTTAATTSPAIGTGTGNVAAVVATRRSPPPPRAAWRPRMPFLRPEPMPPPPPRLPSTSPPHQPRPPPPLVPFSPPALLLLPPTPHSPIPSPPLPPARPALVFAEPFSVAAGAPAAASSAPPSSAPPSSAPEDQSVLLAAAAWLDTGVSQLGAWGAAGPAGVPVLPDPAHMTFAQMAFGGTAALVFALLACACRGSEGPVQRESLRRTSRGFGQLGGRLSVRTRRQQGVARYSNLPTTSEAAY